MQRRRLEQQLDGLVVELLAKARMVPQRLRQPAHVVLGAPQVVAGLVVARLRQGCHGHDGDVLDHGDLPQPPLHLLLQVGRLVAEEIPGVLEGEMGGDARVHDQRAERLHDVVHRAHLEPARLVVLAGTGRQEDHRHVHGGRVRLELPARFVAVHVRHHHVKQDQAWRRGRGDAHRRTARGRHLHPIAILKQRGHHRDVFWKIIHHENRGLGIGNIRAHGEIQVGILAGQAIRRRFRRASKDMPSYCFDIADYSHRFAFRPG